MEEDMSVLEMADEGVTPAQTVKDVVEALLPDDGLTKTDWLLWNPIKLNPTPA
jgi:hypothetical protein